MSGIKILEICITLLVASTCNAVETISIQTPSGGLKGKVSEYDSRKVLQFYNIPYAKPPIGQLRFADPVPFGPWEDERAAIEIGHMCPQDYPKDQNLSVVFKKMLDSLTPTSEDCLYLNVHVPDEIKDGRMLPVMLWIHGGGFVFGDGGSSDGTFLAFAGDVIVVTINYRLGALGFFSTGDDVSTGNQGLKDQRLAMQWVQANIRAFGGDPDSVTIFGESAGSWSVAHHLINAKNKGLFRRAILQSGTNGCDVGICPNSRSHAVIFGIDAGCLDNETTEDTLDSKQLLNCLRGFPTDHMVRLQTQIVNKLMASGITNCFNGPIVDGNLITRKPLELLKDTSSEEYAFFRSIDVIAGTNSFEGGMFSPFLAMFETSMNFTVSEGIPYDAMCSMVSMFTPTLFSKNINETTEKICEHLKSENKIEQGINILKFVADGFFTVPMKRFLNAHAVGNTASQTYEYLFSYELKADLIVKRQDWIVGQGSDHGTELTVIFGPEGWQKSITESEYGEGIGNLRNQIMKYWTNFAKTGNPNSNGLADWPIYREPKGDYLNLNIESKSEKDLFAERVKFLMETIPSVVSEQSDQKDEL